MKDLYKMKVTIENFVSQSAKIEAVLNGMEETAEVRQLKELVQSLRFQLTDALVDQATDPDPGDPTPVVFKNTNYSFLCRTYEPSYLRTMKPNERMQYCIGLVNWCRDHNVPALDHWLKTIANNGN